MSEQAYRRFMERYRRRMADRQPPKHDAWMDEPVLGREQELGVLGLPLPRAEPDLADIVLDLLASADEPTLGAEAQALARAGRGGDTAIGHLTPGEIVIPQRLQTPEVIAALARASHATGAPLQRMQVGHPANRINPKTGAPEFDDDTEVKFGDQDPSAGDPGDSAAYSDPSGAGGANASSAGIAPIAVEGDPGNDITISAPTPPPSPNPTHVDNFFERFNEPLSKLANDLHVPASTILGLAAFEGGWGTDRKNNLFGLLDEKGQKRSFKTPEDSIAAFRQSQWPRRLQGLQNLPDFFAEMRSQPVYNTGTGPENGYYSNLRDTIDTVRFRQPQWQGSRGK